MASVILFKSSVNTLYNSMWAILIGLALSLGVGLALALCENTIKVTLQFDVIWSVNLA